MRIFMKSGNLAAYEKLTSYRGSGVTWTVALTVLHDNVRALLHEPRA
jgi:hypothetical protein